MPAPLDAIADLGDRPIAISYGTKDTRDLPRKNAEVLYDAALAAGMPVEAAVWGRNSRSVVSGKGRGVRVLWGLGLGFLVSAAGWIVVIWTMDRDLGALGLIALWAPVVAFALLGLMLRGWGLLGAFVGAVLAVPFAYGATPVVNLSMGEAAADSVAWGIPIELVVWMVPAGLIGWAAGAIGSRLRLV